MVGRERHGESPRQGALPLFEVTASSAGAAWWRPSASATPT